MSTTPTSVPTAPADRSTRSTSIPYVVAGGVILGAVGVWAAVTHHPQANLVVRYVLVGVVYLAVGWWLGRQGHPALGILVALTGAVWFIPEFQDTRRGALVGIAILFEDVYRATYGHAVLAYPDGRVRPRFGVWVVWAGYFLTLVGGSLRALTYQPYLWQSCDCPRNGFAIWHSQSLYNGVNDVYRVIGAVLAVALIVLLVVKTRAPHRAGADVRPVWGALAGTVIIAVSGFLRDQLDLSRNGVVFWLWVEGAGLLVTALSLLLLRRRSAMPEPA